MFYERTKVSSVGCSIYAPCTTNLTCFFFLFSSTLFVFILNSSASFFANHFCFLDLQ
eukprot:m.254528 g.254528  ORF g.254528 m.254528 type:complete len:57 (+) comp143151_c0_seq1:46-216(+)